MDLIIELLGQTGEAISDELGSWTDDPPWGRPAVKEPDRSFIGTPYENSSSVTYYQEEDGQ